MKKMMVVGASGVLGKLICMELLRVFEKQIKLIVTDYKNERGKRLAAFFNSDVQFQCLDVDNEENIKQVIKNVDIVVVAVKQRNPHIQKRCIENKILCIDVTPFYDFAEKVYELNQSAENNKIGSVIMSGFFPGLSGLMIKEAISDFQEITEINVGLLQSTNAKAGISGILDMLKIIDQPVTFQNETLSGFTKKRRMYFLNHFREKEVRLIDHSEKLLLKGKLTTAPINYWTSWNVNAFNKLVSMIRKMGFMEMINKVNNNFLSKVVRHNPNKNENAFLTVEVKGVVDNKERVRILFLSTFSDYHTTAMVTASLAKIALKSEVKGIICPFELTNLEEILSVINCPDIQIKEVNQ
ncbi:saccharopine dehydrogenase NADP-binding domain-containing protein [Robertmurraya sp. FSL W8-0741]|uniref:saccharopine dehydrogenase NADP-binding domain-containing protein n=1 Tax=Robertmurraya sp. FSL W8-0741 TaxID=2954629 RepID=UPI0030F9A92F